MSWNGQAGILPFDVRPETAHPAGWYRFVSPPGLRAMSLTARGKVQAWADGKPMSVSQGADGKWRLSVTSPSAASVRVAVRIEQERGAYAGATLPEPIALECGPGTIEAGDWSLIDGLASYSGGAWYRKNIALTAAQAAGPVTLDLGSVVSSAEVRINGKTAGIRVAAPWTFDLRGLTKAGENRVEVLVYNTLANHYSTIPSHYRGKPVSGILGPVRLELGKQ